MTPLISEIVKLVPDPEMGMWFDMGNNALRPDGHVPDTEMFALPYPVCFLVWHQSDGTAAVFRLHLSDTHKSMSVSALLFGSRREWMREAEPFIATLVDSGLQISQPDGTPPSSESEYREALHYVEDFLLSLQQEQTAYKPTARPSFINSKRAAKGKGPVLFDWHTVTVAPTPAKGEHQGGTHASPRLHDRRGHWRKYPSGKVGWVKNCKVGDASRGAVFKDYEVKQ